MTLRETTTGSTLMSFIDTLARDLGPRGWWPLPSLSGRGGRNAGGYLNAPSLPIGSGYFPGDGPGKSPGDGRAAALQRFEVAVGAVLAQNTAWRGASQAVAALAAVGRLSPDAIADIDLDELAELLRPAGTFRRKAVYLKNLAAAWPAIEKKATVIGYESPDAATIEARIFLLSLDGIGPETADCILVYAYGQPLFVADAYARRIFARRGWTPKDSGYEAVRQYAEARLPNDAAYLAEAHALLVEHAKRFCRARPLCAACSRRIDCPTSK